ncbi:MULTISPECIES: beta-galactosidase [unclassified Microbacterium]|uniref:beta-galactosidase n=1 Tax=unclassified Microbacterium TaxID=2609290 RepID=UPI000D509AED|nr:beta-galactosidase [Microbacterium sp. TPD7012]PVE96864.1 beta-galactosidase [Microbacterium sp. TPD7012]
MPNTQYSPGRFLFGGDYNPEQWSRETWAEDIELMRRAKVNTVTIGVFSWAMLEPREGEFDAAWLDEVIAGLDAAGIGFFLATPTASPPPWFTVAHPDALPIRADGTAVLHGSRDTYAISAPAYREAARRIARFLGERYGAHRGLQGWHIHNEYGTVDYGPHAARAFREWLRAKYGSLDALNAAWYTAFWSQRYGDWEQILPPLQTQYLHNPAHLVDFRRFNSDEMLAAYREQRAEIRATGSTAPMTTNFMLPTWNFLDQWSWSSEQEVVSIDHYLDTDGPDGEAHVAYGSDLTRSWAGGPWVLMEQNATGIRVGEQTLTKQPDRMIRNSLGYIARGSQSSLFFQWRASAGGSELWHGALVPHAGADSRAFEAVVELGDILEKIAEVAAPPEDGPVTESQAAIVWDAEGWWSLETPHLPNDAITYSDEVRAAHRALWRGGHSVDFVRPGADVSAYRMLVVPALYAITSATAEWLEEYVHAGGHLVVTFATGLADENQRIVTGGYPGMLRSLLGVRGEQIFPRADGDHVSLSNGMTGGSWTELLRTETADVVARYETGPLAGMPAITRRAHGEGAVTYVSTKLEQESLDGFLAEIAARSGVEQLFPEARELGVEAVRRRGAAGDYLFLLHHGEHPARVVGEGTDLLTGASDSIVLEPGGVAVIRERSRSWSISPASSS